MPKLYAIVIFFVATCANAQDVSEISGRLNTYSKALNFAQQQVRAAIDALPRCRLHKDRITNIDFTPNIPFTPQASAPSIYRLDVPIRAFVDTTEGATTGPVVTSRDGGIALGEKAPPADVVIRDGVLVLNEFGADCAAEARISLLPAFTDAHFKIVNVIGRRGPGVSRFTIPYGSDFRSDNGNLLISDCTNGIIQEFSLHGELVNWFGGNGTRPGEFSLPADVKFRNGKIYVAEESNNRLQIFDGDGRYLRSIGVPGGNVFSRPLGVAIAANGDLFVTDYDANRIKRVTGRGQVAVTSSNKPGDAFQYDQPYYIDIDPRDGAILITNRGANEIAVLSPNGSEKVATFGSGILNYPHELAVGPDGHLYVADMLNRRLAIFPKRSDAGVSFVNFPQSWGMPKTVAINKDGLLAVGFSGGSESFIAMLNARDIPLPRSPVRKSPVVVQPESLGTTASLYRAHCLNCHERGVFGAPKRGDADDWRKFGRDMDTLVSLTVAGKGAMIPKGGCSECSDEDIKRLIQYLLPDNWAD